MRAQPNFGCLHYALGERKSQYWEKSIKFRKRRLITGASSQEDNLMVYLQRGKLTHDEPHGMLVTRHYTDAVENLSMASAFYGL